MKKNSKFNVKELTRKELTECNGGWGWIVSATIGLAVFAYQAGKDSYAIHPDSLI